MLTERDIAYIYRQFDSNPTHFDCGKLCAPDNDGVPYCCDSDWLIPVMYKYEYTYLKKKSNLWKRFKPKTKHEQNIVDETDNNTVFGDCLGHENCDRRFRSVCCRIFPFEPYLDLDGNLLGLTYSYRLDGECPILFKPDLVSKKFISDQIKMWKYIFRKEPGEIEVYREQSIQIRRYCSRKERPLYILTPKGYCKGTYRMR